MMTEKSRGRKPFAALTVGDFMKSSKLDFSDMTQAQSYDEYLNWTVENGYKSICLASFNKFFVKPVSSKKISISLSLSEQFKLLGEYVGLVNDGILKALYVHGEPGIGKTETVTNTLKKLKAKAEFYSGGVKGAHELAKILYENRENKVIVLDDFDSVFRSKPQVDLLKAALTDKDSKIISWIDDTKRNLKDKVPQKFTFTSSVIFISNDMRLNPAIRSRCKIMNFQTTKNEILDYIHSNFNGFLKSIPLEFKEEVYKFMKMNLSSLKRVDFRSFKFAVADLLLDKRAGLTNNRWKKIVLNNAM